MRQNLNRRLEATKVLLPEGAPSGTQGRILVAALRLFSERSFHGTSIREIAKAANVRSASLYGHYESKAHILSELLRLGYAHHLAAMEAALVDAPDDPAHQLAALVRAHVEVHAGLAMLAVVATNELHALDPAMAAPLVVQRDRSAQVLIDVVERGMGAGVFSTPSAWLTVAAIGAMGMRVAHWYHPNSRYTIDEVADTYAELALRMVGAS